MADADKRLDHSQRLSRRLQGLAQHDDIEGAGRVGLKIAVGVALNDRQAMADTGVDTRLAEFDAASIDPFVPRQMCEQCAVSAADVENP